MKTLRAMKENEDELLEENEKFGDYRIERFEKGLEKSVENLKRWDPEGGDRVRARGKELVTLMRDTARWHCEQYAKGVKEYERLNKSPPLARSAEHFNATKELFGIVLDARDEIRMTLDDASRVLDGTRCDDTFLEEFDRLTKDLNRIRDTRYSTFDSDQMHGLLRVCCRFDGANSRWHKQMTFWE